MRRFLIPLLVLVALAIPTSAWEASTSANLSIGVTQSQAISNVALSGSSFAGGAGSGTIVGPIMVTMTPTAPPFSGTLSLSGTNASSFQLVGSNLETNGILPAGAYQINLVATQPGATGSPFTQPETITGTTATASTCPRGTAYADGCAGAQSSGSGGIISTFFTSYTGTNYGANRPPWNVARVDYPVGYAGTLNDPSVSANLPACARYASNMVTINANTQPCTLSELDFSLHGGICISITGSKANTVMITDSKFSSNMTVCPYFLIRSYAGPQNLTIAYSDFQDNFAGFDAEVEWDGSGILTIEYNNFNKVSCRIVNSGAQTGAQLYLRYNYLQDIGTANTAGCHGETVEWNTSNTIALHNESFNNYYATPFSCCDTAFLYIQSAIGSPQHGAMITAIATNNTLITRPNPSQMNEVAVSGALWIDTTFGNTIGSLTVDSNYIDPAGSYFSILDNHGGSDPGSIEVSTCVGNKLMATGAGITGTFGGGSSTMICN